MEVTVRLLILLLAQAFLLTCMARSRYPAERSPRPNVIVIVADDLGYGDLSSFGGTAVQTPEIDRLVCNGLKFTDFHSNGATCTPTRAALLTGSYQQRAGIEGVILVRGETREAGLDTSTITIAELMRQKGYATGLIGKWHLGYHPKFNPVNHGFDEFRGYLSGNVDYHSHYDAAAKYDWWHNRDSVRETGYTTDLITDHAVNFINKHREQPFFLMITHEAPHFPLQGRDDAPLRLPGRSFNPLGYLAMQDSTYGEMIMALDEGVGRVMRALSANGLDRHTLVFFLSDNGAEERFGSNGVLSGAKGSLLEGGHRVPAVAYWEGRIQPGISDHALITMDLVPTILSICGEPDAIHAGFDGMDVSAVLFGHGTLEKRTLFWRTGTETAARSGDWKLLMGKKDTVLYNVRNDLRETTDLADRHPEIVRRLRHEILMWERSVGHRHHMKLP